MSIGLFCGQCFLLPTAMWFDDDDDDITPEQPVKEPGDYDLGDELGEKVGEDSSSEESAL